MAKMLLVVGFLFALLIAYPQLAYQLGLGSVVTSWKYGSTIDVSRNLPLRR